MMKLLIKIIQVFAITSVLVLVSCGPLSSFTLPLADKLKDPDAPVISDITHTATDSEAFITLQWQAPTPGREKDGTSAKIARYYVYWKMGETVAKDNSAGMAPMVLLPAEDSKESITIRGLNFETEYSVMIVVENSAELTATSNIQTVKTSPQTSALPPETVQNFTAQVPDDIIEVNLSWTPVEDFGTLKNGAPDTFREYRLYWEEGDTVSTNGNAKRTFPNSFTSAYTINATELKGATQYTIAIVAVNSGNLSSNISKAAVTTANLSSPPGDVLPVLSAQVVSHTVAEIVVSWDVPTPGTEKDAGPASLELYRIYWAEGSVVDISTADNQIANSLSSSSTIQNLMPGKEYSVAVIATNTAQRESNVLTESIHIASSQETDPADPDITSVVSVSTSSRAYIELEWTANSAGLHADGSPARIVQYHLYWKSGNAVSNSDYDGSVSLAGDAKITQIQNLNVDTQYSVLLVAESSNGRFTAGVAVTERTDPATTAMPPEDAGNLVIETEPGTTGILLSWEEPAYFGQDIDGRESTLKEYQIYVAEGDSASITGIPYVTQSSSYTIPAADLSGNQQYAVAIVVVSMEDLYSNALQGTITTNNLAQPPGDITVVQVDVTHTAMNEMKIYWSPAAKGRDSSGAAAETKYELYFRRSDSNSQDALDLMINGNKIPEDIDEGASIVEYTFVNLEAGLNYDVVVVPVNSMQRNMQGTPHLQRMLRSNGVNSVIIQEGNVPVTAKITKSMADEGTGFDLEAVVDSYNVDTSVVWTTSDSEGKVALLTENGNTVSISIVGSGTATITARSVVDAAKADSVDLVVNKIDIGNSILSYGDTPLNSMFGEDAVYGTTENTIPADARVDFTTDLQISEITVDQNGNIIVDRFTPVGTYALAVSGIVMATDPKYTGSVLSSQVNIEVGTFLFYKEEMHDNAKTVFGIGDVDNPYLFTVVGLDPLDNTSASIIITEEGSEDAVYNQENILLNNFLDLSTSLSVMGFGANENPIDFETLPDRLTITVVVNKDAAEYAQARVNVIKADAEHIYTWRDYQKILNNLTGNYTLQNDFVFPEKSNYGFDTLTIIGDMQNPFTGSFDGQGYTISNLFIEISFSDLTHAGLFGTIDSAVLENVIVDYKVIQSGGFAGALVGFAKNNSRINNVGSISTGISDITGFTTTGGVVGSMSDSMLTGYSTVDIAGINDIGGLVGRILGTSSVVGYTTGDISGQGNVGGLVGEVLNSECTVKGYATGDISGYGNIGGLVGRLVEGSVQGYARSGIFYRGNTNNMDPAILRVGVGTLVGYLYKEEGTVLGNAEGYASASESNLHNIDLVYADGFFGIEVLMAPNIAQSVFSYFDFSTEWEWVSNGKWPAIEIGTLKPVSTQPVEP